MPIDQGLSGDLLSVAQNQFADNFTYSVDFVFVDTLNLALNNGFTSTLFTIMKTLAFALVLLYFLIDMEQQIFKKDFSLEHVVRGFLKLFIGYACVANVQIVLDAINGITGEIVGLVNTGQGGIRSPVATMIRTWSARLAANGTSVMLSVTEWIYLTAGVVAGCFILFALIIVVTTVAVKRALELTVYYILSPIMIADVYSGGTTIAAIRLRRIFALYMQYPFVSLILSFGTQLLTSARLNGALVSGSALYVSILIMWALVKFIAKSKSEVERMFS